MDGLIRNCLRTLGVLLLLLIFSFQAHASFPQKAETDFQSALETAKKDLREAVQNYESEFQQRIADEDALLDQNITPSWNLVAAKRGK